jgi:phosphoenolpyruvate synthase/pyruvate phosphate dikinase
MNMCVLDLKALTNADHKYVGHKAANLGELHQIKGIQVPDGFCITTAAFKESAPIKKLTASLDGCGLNDMDRIRWISSEIRSLIEVAKQNVFVVEVDCKCVCSEWSRFQLESDDGHWSRQY